MSSRSTIYGVAFVVGFCGLVAQVVVLREMLVTFYGNELSMGVMLAAWLLWTGLGSLGLGRLAPKLRQPRLWLAGALLVGAGLLVATVGGARGLALVFRLRGETLGAVRPFRLMLVSSAVLLAPFCLVNGWLFPLACRAAGAQAGEGGGKVGWVYLAEAAGAAAGGACYSLLLAYWVGPLTLGVALGAAWCATAAACALTGRRGVVATALTAGAGCGALAALVALGAGWPTQVARRFDAAYWRPIQVVASRDSRYGRVAVLRPPGQGTQGSLYHHGRLAFSFPDPQAAEEQVHLPMLQHPEPRRVLLLGGSLGGAVGEVLKHPSVERVTCVELDPAAVDAVRRHFPPEAGALLDGPRVELVLDDGRAFLKRTRQRYDVAINGHGPPTTAQVNRYYTRECFAAVARVLAPGGIFAFRAAGGQNYIPDANRRLLASLHHTVAAVFPHVVVFPGAQCTILASTAEGMPGYQLDVLDLRMGERGVATSSVDPLAWQAALMGGRLEELEQALAVVPAPPLNRDLAPRCYFLEAQRWSAEQRARAGGRPALDLGRVLAFLDRRPWVAVAVPLAVLVAVALLPSLVRGRVRDGALSLAVGATGVIEMAVEFVVLLGFQVAYGYVYQYVGVLMAAFMVGLACGAWASSRWVEQGRATWRRLGVVQACICVYPLVLLGFLHVATGTRLGTLPLFAGAAFALVAFVAGFVGGLQFPLAAALHTRGAASAGALYGTDLFGACLGALVVSAVVVPIFGMASVCVMMAALGGAVLAAIVGVAGWQGKSG